MKGEKELVIYTVEIKARPVFVCSVCGRNQEGGTMKLEFTGPTVIDDIPDMVKMSHVSNHFMPVGWMSTYRREGSFYRCKECQK